MLLKILIIADPPGATLVILDNMGWYCDVATDCHKIIQILSKVALKSIYINPYDNQNF
jgi:hypothetical protein